MSDSADKFVNTIVLAAWGICNLLNEQTQVFQRSKKHFEFIKLLHIL